MKDVKTARGRNLNMAILAAQNEETRAISNVPVNAKGDIIDNRGNVKVPREKVSKEYYKDNLTGIEETISIKEDAVQEPVAQAEPEPPQPKPKAKKKEAPAPKVEPVVPVVTEEEQGVTEVGRRSRTREDGSKYWEIEFSDGSMTTEEDSGVQ